MQVKGAFHASRADTSDGTRVAVGFFGSGPSRLFGALHTPAGIPRVGVVICSPLHADFAKIYRSEVLLGRALSRGGLAVLRFHYRGQGHSDGDSSQMTLRMLNEDARAAAEYLRSMTGVGRVAFMGCRLGGFIAAGAAALHDAAPVVLWEPVLESRRYFQEAIRARLITKLSGAAERPPSQDFKEDLGHDGYVDVGGYPVYPSLIESMDGITLSDELGDLRRPILLVQIGRSPTPRLEYAAIANAWSRLGLPVAVRCVVGEMAWWVRGARQDRDSSERLAAEAVDRTAEWMREQFPAGEVVG